MKTLTKLKTVIDGDQVTITGTVIDKTFSFPTQQVTIGFMANNNPNFIRHAQISQEAIFVKAYGRAFALPLEEMIDNVAMIIEPRLSFPPLMKSRGMTVELISELQPSLQWQVAKAADAPEGEWQDVPGETTRTFDKSKVPPQSFVRCKATSEAGTSITPIIQV